MDLTVDGGLGESPQGFPARNEAQGNSKQGVRRAGHRTGQLAKETQTRRHVERGKKSGHKNGGRSPRSDLREGVVGGELNFRSEQAADDWLQEIQSGQKQEVLPRRFLTHRPYPTR